MDDNSKKQKNEEKKYVVYSSGTWSCVPSTYHITVHSESAMKFMSGFPSYIPREATYFSFIQHPQHTSYANTIQ